MINTRTRFFWLAGIMLLFQGQLSAQHTMLPDNGETTLIEVSCNERASEIVNRGLVMLHHMMYDQAIDIFREAADADQQCAMAYWGVAMTQLNPLWAPPNDDMLQTGWEAIEEAKSRSVSTDSERELINALYSYYQITRENDYEKGLKAWEEELRQSYQNNPDDVEIGAFYGLSMLATASNDDETFSQKREAGEIMEQLSESSPEHPGLFHYIIHAYDNPVLAEKGVTYANGYEDLAPDVPHALHMPSHIFVRLGRWDETIRWNRRSGDAALKQPVGEMTSMHHAHAMDYMMYGYLQKADDAAAESVYDELIEIDNYQPLFGSAYGVAAAQARYVLERDEWEEAMQLEPRPGSGFDWDQFPQYEAIGWWAIGIGAVKSDELDRAHRALEKLEKLHSMTLEKGEEYWARLVDVQRKSVQAWILYEEGDTDDAVVLMKDAADQEDSVDKHPVTPGEVLPARELLAEMFLDLGQPEEALRAYEKTLQISPNRFKSLYGAGKAAELSGNEELAETYYEKLLEMVNQEKSRRPQILNAHQFLTSR